LSEGGLISGTELEFIYSRQAMITNDKTHPNVWYTNSDMCIAP